MVKSLQLRPCTLVTAQPTPVTNVGKDNGIRLSYTFTATSDNVCSCFDENSVYDNGQCVPYFSFNVSGSHTLFENLIYIKNKFN
jgi:hypothetical protein